MSLASVDRTTGSRHFKPLDGLRGIAILAVILHHAYHHDGADALSRTLTFLSGAGWIGVTLFFVLSGFLIGGILMDAVGTPHWYRGFFARRALRILPLYFTFLLLYWFVLPHWNWAAAHLSVPHGKSGIVYWVYLANMRERIAGSGGAIPALDPLWSLSVEEQIYFILPLMIWLFPFRRLGVVLLGLFACSVAWKFGTGALRQGIEPRYSWTPACLDAFATGALVAWMSRAPRWREKLPSIARWCAAVAALPVIGLMVRDRGFQFWDDPLYVLSLGTVSLAIFFAAVIALSVSGSEQSSMNRLMSMRWLRWCGQYSYAAYLFHAVVIELLKPLFSQTGCVFVLAVGAMTFAAARISWEILEKHFIALKRFFPAPSRVVRAA